MLKVFTNNKGIARLARIRPHPWSYWEAGAIHYKAAAQKVREEKNSNKAGLSHAIQKMIR